MSTHNEQHTAGVPAIEFDRVCYAFEGAPAPALDGITLRIEPGERVGVLGPNGAGKTTLVRLALGLLGPTSGAVRVFGESPAAARAAGWVGYVPQRSSAELAFPLSVRQVVEMPTRVGLAPWTKPDSAAREAVEYALGVTGCGEFAKRPIGRVSGGQLQRAMIARALASRPRLLVLDEPTVGIDAVGQRQFSEMLEEIRQGLGVTVVVVTHDLRTIAAGCDRVACLHRTLHSHGSPEGLTPAVLAEVFRHEVEGVFGAVHVDAHRAAECNDPGHTHSHHTHGEASDEEKGGGDADR